jgi:hypothetical protein
MGDAWLVAGVRRGAKASGAGYGVERDMVWVPMEVEFEMESNAHGYKQ